MRASAFDFEAVAIGVLVVGMIVAFYIHVFRRFAAGRRALVAYMDARAEAQRAAMTAPEPPLWLRFARILSITLLVCALAAAMAFKIGLF